MKKTLLLIILAFLKLTLSAQDCTELKNDSEIRQELQDMANSAGIKLMSCCATWGGRGVRSEIHWGKDESGVCMTRVSKLSNKITITMTVSWQGSVTGASYWIKGRLIIDDNGKIWEKISDSKNFGTNSGCGSSCIN